MQHNCNQLPKSPVCDTDNVEHPNICWMLQKRKSLAYYGKCMVSIKIELTQSKLIRQNISLRYCLKQILFLISVINILRFVK